MKNWTLPRRSFLKGGSAVIALPFLEAMLPFGSKAFAQSGKSPVRLLCLYKPNGEFEGSWNMTNNVLPFVLEPLQSVRNDLTIVRGLRNRAAEGYNDGHAPHISCFLTGGPVVRSTSTIEAPRSIDQLIADAKGSTVLNIAGPNEMGAANGFNGEYFSNVSWRGPRAAPKIKSPRALFDLIFQDGTQTPMPPSDEERRRRTKETILSYTQTQSNRVMATLGASDRAKLDEYLTSVREVEAAIGEQEQVISQCIADTGRPSDNNSFENHTKIMLDLLVLALQCGRTEVATYLLDVEVGYGYRNHHSISHYNDNGSYPQQYREINRWYISQLTYLLNKMKSVQEHDGTLLDNSLVLYGNGQGDGNKHDTWNLGVIVAGKAGGAITPGRVLNKSNQHLTNLTLTILRTFGINRTSFGDSTGFFTDL